MVCFAEPSTNEGIDSLWALIDFRTPLEDASLCMNTRAGSLIVFPTLSIVDRRSLGKRVRLMIITTMMV
jgi:hypothetical protein